MGEGFHMQNHSSNLHGELKDTDKGIYGDKFLKTV